MQAAAVRRVYADPMPDIDQPGIGAALGAVSMHHVGCHFARPARDMGARGEIG